MRDTLCDVMVFDGCELFIDRRMDRESALSYASAIREVYGDRFDVKVLAVTEVM